MHTFFFKNGIEVYSPGSLESRDEWAFTTTNHNKSGWTFMAYWSQTVPWHLWTNIKLIHAIVWTNTHVVPTIIHTYIYVWTDFFRNYNCIKVHRCLIKECKFTPKVPPQVDGSWLLEAKNEKESISIQYCETGIIHKRVWFDCVLIDNER